MDIDLRRVEVVKGADELGYGFTVTGEQPAILSAIQEGSAAQRAGLRARDILLSVNGEDVSAASHERIVALVGRTRNSIRLTVMSNESRSRRDVGRSAAEFHDQLISRGDTDSLGSRTGSLSHSYGTGSDSHYLFQARPAVNQLSNELTSGDDTQMRGQRRSLHEALTTGSLTSTSATSGSFLSGHHLDAHTISPDMLERASEIGDYGSSSSHDHRRYGHLTSSKSSSVHSIPTGSASTGYRHHEQLAGMERHMYPVFVAYFGGSPMSGRLADKDERLRMTRECVAQARREHRRPQTVKMLISAWGIRLVDVGGSELLTVPRSSIALTWVDTADHRVFSLIQRHSSASTMSEASPTVHTTTGHVFKVLPSGYQLFEDQSGSQSSLASQKDSSGAWPIIRLLKYLYGGRSDRKHSRSHAGRPESTESSESSGSRLSPAPYNPSPQLSDRRVVGTQGGLASSARTGGGLSRDIDDSLDRTSELALSARSASALYLHGADTESERSSREWDGESEGRKRTGSDPDMSTLQRNRKGTREATVKPDDDKGQVTSPQSGSGMLGKRSGSLESIVSVNVISPKKPERPEAQPSQPAIGRVAGWAANINLLLEDPKGVELFREFLQSAYCEENILFYFAAMEYKESFDESSKAKVNKRVEEIYSEFIDADAPNVINIDCKVRRQIESDRSRTPTKTMFDAAMGEVFKLMKTDSHPKFTRSDRFRTYMLAELEGKPLPWDEKPSEEHKKQEKDKEKSSVFGKLFSFNIGKSRSGVDLRSGASRPRPGSSRQATGKVSGRPDSVTDTEETELTSTSEIDLNNFKPLSRSSTSASALTLNKWKKDNHKHSKWSGSLPWRRHGTVADHKKEFSRGRLPSSEDPTSDLTEPTAHKTSDSRPDDNRVMLRVVLPDNSMTVLRGKPTSVLLDILKPLLQGKGLLIDNVDIFEVQPDKSQERATPTQTLQELKSSDVSIHLASVINLSFSDGSMDYCRPQYGCSIQDVISDVLTQRGLTFNNVSIKLDDSSGQEKLDIQSPSHSAADRTLIVMERQRHTAGALGSSRDQTLPNGSVVETAPVSETANEKTKRQTSFRTTFRKRFSRRKSITAEIAPDINQTLPRNFRSQPSSPTLKEHDSNMEREKHGYFTMTSSHNSTPALSLSDPATPTKRGNNNASFEEELMDPNSPAHGLLSMLDKMQSDRLDDQRQPVSTHVFSQSSLGSSASSNWLLDHRLPSGHSSSPTSSASTLPVSVDELDSPFNLTSQTGALGSDGEHDHTKRPGSSADTTDSPSSLPRRGRKLPRFSSSSLERRPRSKSVSLTNDQQPLRRSNSVSLLSTVRSLSLERRRKRTPSNPDISDGQSSTSNVRPSSGRKATTKRKGSLDETMPKRRDPVEDFMSNFNPRLTSQTNMPMWSK